MMAGNLTNILSGLQNGVTAVSALSLALNKVTVTSSITGISYLSITLISSATGLPST